MTRNSSFLTPPPSRAETRGTATARFSTRPGAVRRWVRELPVANLGELGRRLHQALHQVNHQPNSTRRLFYFLEAIGPAAHLVLENLHRQYAHQPLPLNDAGARAAQLAMELLAQLLRGYRTVQRSLVPDKEEPSRWRLFWRRRELTVTLHRFIRYGDAALEAYRVTHTDPPEGVWRRIHRCYRLAEAHKLTSRRVARFDAKRRKSTIALEYHRLLLSSMLPKSALTQPQQVETENSLDEWAQLLRLVVPSEAPPDCHYMVRLGRDAGVVSLGAEEETEEHKRGSRRLLDTQALGAALAQRRARGGKGKRWRREHDVDPETLTVLQDQWCTLRARRELREAVDLPADVALGLGALFRVAGGEPIQERPAAPVAAPGHSITLEPLAESGGNWMSKRTEADVWEEVYGQAAKAKHAAASKPVINERLALHNPDPGYTAVKGRLVDRSENGLAVHLTRNDVRQVAVGMPVAVRTEGADWLVGTVMRMKNRGEAVELGVRTLLRGALPARLRVREGARISPPFDVVVGTTHDNYRGVVAPMVTALRSGAPELLLEEKTLPVNRGAALTHSRYLDAFVIEFTNQQTLATVQEAAKKASAALCLRDGPAPATTPAAPLKSREERVTELMTRTGVSRADAEFIVEAEADAAHGSTPN